MAAAGDHANTGIQADWEGAGAERIFSAKRSGGEFRERISGFLSCAVTSLFLHARKTGKREIRSSVPIVEARLRRSRPELGYGMPVCVLWSAGIAISKNQRSGLNFNGGRQIFLKFFFLSRHSRKRGSSATSNSTSVRGGPE